MECGSYREIKLLEHAMKVVERISEHIIRQQIEIDDMLFEFMKGKGTTLAREKRLESGKTHILQSWSTTVQR